MNIRKEQTKKMKKILTSLVIILLTIVYIPNSTHAAAASFYLSPASLSRQIGSNFTIFVGMNSGGNPVNAFEATINIPTNILTITGAGTGGSLCSLWIQTPAIAGPSVSFKCGVTGGTTASGNMISISLKGKAVGTGMASISGARILAGPGQNVTGGTSGGTYTITAPPPPPPAATAAPAVSSSTHPDQNAWYTNNNPAFSWTRGGGTKGFSYAFDQNPGTVPASAVNTNANSISFQNKADGIWYFHIRASGNNGWSNTTHFRVQIDRTAPTNLVIVTDPKGEADRRPMVAFNAVDAASGIARYELKMDRGEFKVVTSPYVPNSISSGDHTFVVRAYDKAGNMIEGLVKIKIKEIPRPKITAPRNNSTLKLAQKLEIKGKADPKTVVDIYFDGVNIARGVKVNSNGDWSFVYENFIMPGKHKIFAVAIKDGIESKPSDKIGIRIDPSAISIFGIIIPSTIAFIILLIIIAILLALVIWLFFFGKRKYDRIRDKIRKRNQEAQKRVEKSFNEVEKRIGRDVQATFETDKTTSKIEHELERKVEKDIEKTQESVEKAIEDETKDL